MDINIPVNTSRKERMDKIFLIGFMGSGKTYWGERWASQSNLSFYDLDTLIEKNEGQSVMEIFEKKGEEHFRKKESAILRQFDNEDNYLIACGGGTPCFYDNMQWMNMEGITVYLKASPAEIMDRVLNEKTTRPLIKNLNRDELQLFIEQKLKEREPDYLQATLSLPVSGLTDHSIDLIIRTTRS